MDSSKSMPKSVQISGGESSESDYEDGLHDESELLRAESVSEKTSTWIVVPKIRGHALAKNEIQTQALSTKYLAENVKSVRDAFLLFFPPPFLELMVGSSNVCGRKSCGDAFNDISVELMLAYIGFLVLIGVYRGRNEKIHELFDPYFGRSVFRSIMSFKTFRQTGKVLRFSSPSSELPIPSSEQMIAESWRHWMEQVQLMRSASADSMDSSQSQDNSTDDLQRMLSRYSCKSKTNRLSLITLSRMVDVSALNAFLVYLDVNPNWKAKQKAKRKSFLTDLGLSLAKPYMQSRDTSPRHRASRLFLLQQTADLEGVIGKGDDSDAGDSPSTSGREGKSEKRAIPKQAKGRGRCYSCYHDDGVKERSSEIICCICKKPSCKNKHNRNVCTKCLANTLFSSRSR